MVKEFYPFKSNFLDMNGHKYHYLDEGSGEVILCVHGNPTWSYYYRNLVHKLKDRYRVIVVDHIGCGLSDKPSAKEYDYTLANRVQDLGTLIDHLKLDKLSLVAHDWGGMIATCWATENPDRVNKLVYLNTAGFTMPSEKQFPSSLKLSRIPFFGRLLIQGFNAFVRGANRYCFKIKSEAEDVKAGLASPYDSWRNRIAVYEFVRDIPLAPGDKAYELVAKAESKLDLLRDKPVLLCWGMKDFVFDHHFLNRWLQSFPGAFVRRYIDAGHYVLEDRSEDVVNNIDEFFSGTLQENENNLSRSADRPETSFFDYNVSSFLPLIAERYPEGDAVLVDKSIANIVNYERLSFSELEIASNLYADRLSNLGISAKMRVAVMIKPGLEFFATIFALFKLKAVIVLIDPGIGIRRIKSCLDEAAPEAFIGIRRAHLARKIFGWARNHLKISISIGKSFLLAKSSIGKIHTSELSGKSANVNYLPAKSDEIAAILFTSGSTGAPKGAVYTHGNFFAQLTLLKKAFGIKPGDKDLSTFPLFALFGPALVMTSVIPQMNASKPASANPARLTDAIKIYGCNNMFASPAVVELLGRNNEEKQLRLPEIKRIISAGAPAVPASLARLKRSLQIDAQIFTPYGATEALPISVIGSDEILSETGKLTENGKGVCVGKPIDGIDVKILRIIDFAIDKWDDNLVLGPEEIGEIAVSGPVVTKSYFNRESATKISKIWDQEKSVFWHRMGDLGYFDDKGRLWMCGRKSHRVVTNQSQLFTVPCEAVFNVHPKVRRSALVGIENGSGKKPVLCIELEKGVSKVERPHVAEELLLRAKEFDHTREIEIVLFHDKFPVDIRHNSKIFREKLAIWAEAELH